MPLDADCNGNGKTIAVAAVQMTSGHDRAANLERAGTLIAAAAERGCHVIALPENFAFLGLDEADKVALAEREGAGPIQEFLAEVAMRHSAWIIAGSLPLESPDENRCYGASVVVDPQGQQQACYRKMHLFDVDLPSGDEHYRESATMYAGNTLAVCDTPVGKLGLSICYDVRFPELYRHLVELGAVAFSVPSAFTATTGEAHWHTLLRARAIENLAYVIAPGQVGRHSNGRMTFGHSMIVDPWGRVLAERSDGEGVVIADLDPTLPDRLRAEFPVLQSRQR